MLPPLSLTLPAALSPHLSELSAIPAVVAQQLRPRNREPFMYGSPVLAVVKLYHLQHNTCSEDVVNLVFACVNADTGVFVPNSGQRLATDVADIHQRLFIHKF